MCELHRERGLDGDPWLRGGCFQVVTGVIIKRTECQDPDAHTQYHLTYRRRVPSTLTGPQSVVSGAAFSPDGRLLGAASQDHKLWLWRIGDGRAIADGAQTGADNWLNAVAIAPGHRR